LSSAARTILVTGFEPFGGETINASWEAAQRLEGWRHGEYTAVARLLSCAYDASVKELVRAIETLRPEALLMTGQAARRAAVCVERFAHNLNDAAAPDNDGVLRRAVRISEGAPDRLETAAPVNAIVHAIREAGIPARLSRSAGGFVCNHLYFGALQYLGDKRSEIPAVFLHLPATPGQTPAVANTKRLTPAQAADALRAAAVALVDLWDSSEAA
jgi:pyroglutamyl-peptidase